MDPVKCAVCKRENVKEGHFLCGQEECIRAARRLLDPLERVPKADAVASIRAIRRSAGTYDPADFTSRHKKWIR